MNVHALKMRLDLYEKLMRLDKPINISLTSVFAGFVRPYMA
jgi:4-hydroxybenzoate polyprenyltransferase